MLWFCPLSVYSDVETRHPYLWAFMDTMNGRKIADPSFPFVPHPSDLAMRKTGVKEPVLQSILIDIILEGHEIGWVLDMPCKELLGSTGGQSVFELYEDVCMVVRFPDDLSRFEFALRFDRWEEYELLDTLPPVRRAAPVRRTHG
jgi:hypothetical protein